MEFAEEMQIIRDEKLYPNAGQTNAWKTYCKERWGMSLGIVERHIRALPVLKRLSPTARVSLGAAEAIATLPEPVQNAIVIMIACVMAHKRDPGKCPAGLPQREPPP